MENYLVVENINEKGYGIIPKLVMQDKELTIESKAIYAYFCSYAGAGNQAFPSVSKIISDLKISKDRFYKHLKSLKENGYIKTEQHKSKAQKFTNTIYTLCSKIEKPCPCFTDTENKDTQIEDTGNKDTNNNSIKNNIININKNKTTTTVAVDSHILNLQSKIKSKTNLLINEKSIIKLLESKTEDKIMYYADNWNKIVATTKGEVGGGLFIDAVIKEYSIPKKNENNIHSDVPNMMNFKQRDYTAEELEKYYYRNED